MVGAAGLVLFQTIQVARFAENLQFILFHYKCYLIFWLPMSEQSDFFANMVNSSDYMNDPGVDPKSVDRAPILSFGGGN